MLWLINAPAFYPMPVANDTDVVENDDGTASGVLLILTERSGDDHACSRWVRTGLHYRSSNGTVQIAQRRAGRAVRCSPTYRPNGLVTPTVGAIGSIYDYNGYEEFAVGILLYSVISVPQRSSVRGQAFTPSRASASRPDRLWSLRHRGIRRGRGEG
jgi:hypothetical protein